MNITDALGKLLDNDNKLFNLIKGKFGEWEGWVKGKLGELDSWKQNIPIFGRSSRSGIVLKSYIAPTSEPQNVTDGKGVLIGRRGTGKQGTDWLTGVSGKIFVNIEGTSTPYSFGEWNFRINSDGDSVYLENVALSKNNKVSNAVELYWDKNADDFYELKIRLYNHEGRYRIGTIMILVD